MRWVPSVIWFIDDEIFTAEGKECMQINVSCFSSHEFPLLHTALILEC